MKQVLLAAVVVLLLALPGLAAARPAGDDPNVAPPVPESVRDYLTLRRVGLALAALAFLVGVTRATTSEQPHEQSKARDLLIKAALIFVILAGDRIMARGIAGWFGIGFESLPVFWR